MLHLRPYCECCDEDLPPEFAEVRIGSVRCMFCRDRAANVPCDIRLTCGGELLIRSRRFAHRLADNPGSSTRICPPGQCEGAA